MKNIIVLCTGNSFRSQMAEAYLRKYAAGKANIYSAGVKALGRIPDKTKYLMDDDGIDISSQTSNQVNEYFDVEFDVVLTVCDHANETCPVFPKPVKQKVHQSFPDPERHEGQSEEEYLQSLKPVRDMIKQYCQKFVETYI